MGFLQARAPIALFATFARGPTPHAVPPPGPPLEVLLSVLSVPHPGTWRFVAARSALGSGGPAGGGPRPGATWATVGDVGADARQGRRPAPDGTPRGEEGGGPPAPIPHGNRNGCAKQRAKRDAGSCKRPSFVGIPDGV